MVWRLKNIFAINNNSAQLRLKSEFCLPKVNTKYFGKNSIRYVGFVIWNSFPFPLFSFPVAALSDFKEYMKKRKPDCPCRIYKHYISGVKSVKR